MSSDELVDDDIDIMGDSDELADVAIDEDDEDDNSKGKGEEGGDDDSSSFSQYQLNPTQPVPATPADHMDIVNDDLDEEQNKEDVPPGDGDDDGDLVVISSQAPMIEDDDDDVFAFEDGEEEPDQVIEELHVGTGAGKIERILLTNFMNHHSMELVLGPKINFITGENGSGKSAVLLALTVVLGGSAKSTSRAQKLGALVREGTSTAHIELTLANVGDDAYKPEVYGSRLVIKRTLKRDTNSGSMKLAGENGNYAPLKRQELRLILDRFNITVGNPCVLMMQEDSKKFLGKSRPEEKFKLFERASQVETLRLNYDRVQECIVQSEIIRKAKLKNARKMEKRVAQLHKVYLSMQALKDSRKALISLKNKLAWAYVVATEKEIVEKEGTLAQGDGTMERLRMKIAEYTAKVKTAEDLLSSIAEVNANERDEQQDLRRKMSEDTDERQNAEKMRIKALRVVKICEAKVPAAAKKVKNSLKMITEVGEDGAEDASKQEAARILTEIASLKQERKDKQSQFDEMSAQASTARLQESSAQREVNQLDQDIASAKNRINSLERQVRNAKLTKTNKFAVWCYFAPDLDRLIEKNARDFSHKPVGPIVKYIEFLPGLQKEADLVVETHLKNQLGTYIVANNNDRKLLQKLVNSLRVRNFQVIISAPGPRHRVDRPRPQAQYNILMDDGGGDGCIKITHPWVRDVLVDTTALEQVVIVKQFPSQNIRVNAENIASLPRSANIRTVYSSKATKYTSRSSVTSFLNGKDSRFGQDASEIIRAAEENLHQVNAELASKQRERDEASRKLRKLTDDYRDCNGVAAAAEKEMNSLGYKIGILEEELSKVEGDNGMDDLRRMHEENVAQLTLVEDKLADSRRKADAAKDLIAEFQEARTELEEKMERIKARLRERLNSSSHAQESLKIAIKKLRSYGNAKETLTAQMQTYGAILESLRIKLVGDIEKANSITDNERIPISANQTPENIANQIDSKEKAIAASEAHHGKSLREVEEEYADYLRQFNLLKTALHWLKNFVRLLGRVLKRRKKVMGQLRKHTDSTTSNYFSKYLTARGYEGEVEIDWEAKTLKVHVNLSPGSQASQSQEVGTMSGGETSYATIAMLCSLWEVIQSPFRAVDEFDVFMDEVHRKATVKVLIENARNNPDVQYLFLSPLNKNVIPQDDPDIKVFTMKPPRVPGQRQIVDMM